MSFRYEHAALGGTFDRLHRGHIALLRKAFQNAARVSIGLTTDSMVRDKALSKLILPYEQRRHSLFNFLKDNHWHHKVNLVRLEDPCGPTLTDKSIDCLVVTEQTLSGGHFINQKRTALRLSQLPIIVADMISDDSGEYISSTRIREGKIDRQGRVYNHLFARDIILSQEQKQKLHYPQGILIENPSSETQFLVKDVTKVALVGDVVSQWFCATHINFHYATIDGQNGRQPIQINLDSFKPSVTLTAANQSGRIESGAVAALENLTHHPTGLLHITGEEDLLVIAYIMLLPLNSQVYYGQPSSGIVMIQVTEATKKYYMDFILNRTES